MILLAKGLFAVLLVLGFVQLLVYVPQLPDIMASVFDRSGGPAGRMPRSLFGGIQMAALS